MLAVMKQRSCNNVCPDDSDQEIEYEVAEILCELPQLVLQSELFYLSNLSWGAKKRRNPIGVSRSWSSASPSPSPTQPPPPQTVVSCKNGQVVTISMVKDTSPDTPLSFYPHSESDSRRKCLKRKVSKKKTKEEWEEVLMKKSEQHETFKKEVEKVMEHYKALKKQNLKIKSIMQELNSRRQREALLDSNSSEKRPSLDLLVEPAEPHVPSPAQEQPVVENLVSNVVNQRPAIIHQNPPSGSEIFENSRYPHSQTPPPLPAGIGLAMAPHFGTFGIPDLNFNVDETTTTTPTTTTTTSRGITGMDFFQPFDSRKAAITAEARRRRFEMNKVKKSMANAKTRLQIR